MIIKLYESFPEEAMEVRKTVFVDEQGFRDEFDEIDSYAAHILAFDAEAPIGVCRVFFDKNKNTYVLGRLAVIKSRRNNGVGSAILSEAEKYVLSKGGSELILHSQCRAAQFYKALGYEEFGEIGYEENCPHIWMKKVLKE